MTNGGGTTTTNWINSNNQSSINTNVTLAAASKVGDLVTVRITDGTNTASGTATVTADNQATIPVTGINTTPVTGAVNSSTAAANNITIRAFVQDALGNANPTPATASVGKDISAPAAPTSLTYGQSNGADKLNGTVEANALVTAKRTAPTAGPNFTVQLTGGATTFTNLAVDNNNAGSVTYSVTATDPAGNLGSAATLTVVDAG
jgi:hypothetical protein